MKSRLLALGGIVVVLGSGTAFGVLAQNSAPPSGGHGAGQHGKRERHPELIRALRALQNAKTDLSKASRDYAGHREKAADLTQKAIDEVKAAIASDKT